MPWYVWYVGFGLFYCLICLTFCSKNRGWASTFQSIKEKWMMEDAKKGHIRVEEFDGRKVVQPLDTWGHIQTDTMHDLEKFTKFLEKEGGLAFLIRMAAMLIIAITWPIDLFKDVRKMIRHH